MVKLNKLVAKSRTTETGAATIRMIGVYNGNDWSSDKHLTSIFTELVSASQKLTTAVKHGKAESQLEELDEIRDEKIRAIHYLLTGLRHHPDTAVKTATQTVGKVYDKYGLSVANASYAVETSLINSLLEDLSATDLQASITALTGCKELIAELRTAQTNFEKARIQYEEEKAKERTKESASKIKDEVMRIINDKLVVYLRAMTQVDEAKYGDFARTIAVIIDENNETVNKRKKER